MNMRIGFIGLGIMGEPMCSNILQKSGKEVIVYDRDRERIKLLTSKGAIPASSISEIGEKADIIFTMLPRSEHVVSVYDELLPVIKSGQILIDMSTIDPSVSMELAGKIAGKKAVMLDSPVVKSKPAAISGTLGIYVGGNTDAYEKVKEILLMMGNNVIHMGENGTGLVMKICHNMLVGEIQNGVNEMITLAAKKGISVDSFAKAISYGGGQNFYLDAKAAAIRDGNYTTAFSVENMHKDVNIAVSLAEESGLDLPGTMLVREVYKKAMEKDLGKEDFSATYKIISAQVKI
jgi:3-hydroxyisobutyrate dehydrogenase-like beta-hydroxyacid dehydrogenase